MSASRAGQAGREGGSHGSSASPAVLFASAEVFPFSKVGGLGDVAGSLPRALNENGCTVAVVSPRYGFIRWDSFPPLEHVCELAVEIAGRTECCEVSHLAHGGVSHYFLGNERLFGRAEVYGYDDDLERFAFFSKAVCECALQLGRHVPGFRCDIVHCNDWHTALVPLFLQAERVEQGSVPRSNSHAVHDTQPVPIPHSVLTVHNACFQGEYPTPRFNAACGFEADSPEARLAQIGAGTSSCFAGGLRSVHGITTVSPRYAEEIRTEAGSGRLAEIFRQRADVLRGIVNGIDRDVWNPETDAALARTYCADDPSGKALCKRALLHELGLADDADRPLAVMVSRLTEQKGFDLLCPCLPDIVEAGVTVAILGTGEERFAAAIGRLMHAHPGRVRHIDAFDEQMAHRLYAAGDMLIMPSRFEPCGLSQLIALRYGTLPVVRDTGGLHDTVRPYDPQTGTGAGFVFADAAPAALRDCVVRAAALYRRDPAAWEAMRVRAMREDFGWEQSAREYRRMYERIGEAVRV